MQRQVSVFDVLMEDGQELTARVDQRDFAAWEAADENDGSGRGRHTAARYFVWNALRRAGETALNFKAFNKVCIQAMLVREEGAPDEGEEETEQDNPTQD